MVTGARRARLALLVAAAASATTGLGCEMLVGIRRTVPQSLPHGSDGAVASEGGAAPADHTGAPAADGAGARGDAPPPQHVLDGASASPDGPVAERSPVDAPTTSPRDGAAPDAAAVPPGDRPPPDATAAPPLPPPPDAGPPTCSAATTMGEIDTFAPGEGNCSFPRESLPAFVASVDTALYASAAACGDCLEVTGPRGKVVAQVIDQYVTSPGPRGNKISLDPAGMARVSDSSGGPVALRWRWVPCPAVGPMKAALKSGSSEWAWQVMITNFTNRIARVEFLAPGGAWREIQRESYNYWRHDSAMGLPPQLRLTDVHGNVRVSATLTWPGGNRTGPISLETQFPAACVP